MVRNLPKNCPNGSKYAPEMDLKQAINLNKIRQCQEIGKYKNKLRAIYSQNAKSLHEIVFMY